MGRLPQTFTRVVSLMSRAISSVADLLPTVLGGSTIPYRWLSLIKLPQPWGDL